MTIALWCVLVAGVLHLPFTLAAKWSSRFDNAKPREYFEKLQGWRQRAHWTQLNSFEAFPLFAAAVIIAQIVGGQNSIIDQLAIAFILLRIGYGLCYLADKATLRSLFWLGATGCSLAIFFVAA